MGHAVVAYCKHDDGLLSLLLFESIKSKVWRHEANCRYDDGRIRRFTGHQSFVVIFGGGDGAIVAAAVLVLFLILVL